MAAEKWVKVGEAAAHAGVHPATVKRWIKQRGLKAGRIGEGGHYRLKLSDLDAFLAKRVSS